MQNKPRITEVAAVIPDIHLLEEIGIGGFKVTYRAEVSGTIEAVKIVRIPIDPKDPTIEENNLKRFYRELDILDNCQSPFLVKLGSVKAQEYHIGGYKYICYSEEFIEGESLRSLISTGNLPTQEEVADLLFCLLSAVEELWSLNKVHRDIKPENVLVSTDADRKYILIDLGFAFSVGGSNYTADPRAIPGTRFYNPPEFFKQGFRKSLDYRSDLYLIGLIAYEYGSGVNPFYDRQASDLELVNKVTHHVPTPFGDLRPDIDSGLCSIIDQLLKKIPALRLANFPRLKSQLEVYK